jgi:asparagine synthase (glutamine-hydrolysing)
MCGISGVWDFNKNIKKEDLIKMGQTLNHRGPDDNGFFCNGNIGLYHSRLSIIDISSKGHQPMTYKDKTIIFNGELYNFKDIKKNLNGYDFLSNSDTEVVLKSYDNNGIEALKDFEGMFAFAIWDQRKEKLSLIRDRVGVKPLYYYFDEEIFVFGSEIKSILEYPGVKKELSFKGLSLFLKLGYIPYPYSIFKNIKKVEPGTVIEIDRNRNIFKKKYWEIKEEKPSKSQKGVEEKIEELLLKSFNLRMVSDVPVGIFLSGGIDSSLVTALLSKNNKNLNTFTISFNEKRFDESKFAKEISDYLKTNHTEFHCDSNEAMKIIPNLPEIYDEPFADASAIPYYLLSKKTREKVKVALSADGGDELFCGYDRYWKLKRKINLINIFNNRIIIKLIDILFDKIFSKTKFKNKVDKIRKSLIDSDFKSIYFNSRSYWLKSEVHNLIKNNQEEYLEKTFFFKDIDKTKDIIKKMQLIDFKTYLPDNVLVKADRASMFNGLEVRDPFLNQDLINFAFSLFKKFKYRNGKGKYILRKVLYKNIPKKLVNRPKKGFGVPLDLWLRNDLKYLLDKYVDINKIKEEGILDHNMVEKELKLFLDKKSNYRRIWNILIFQLWKERWLN